MDTPQQTTIFSAVPLQPTPAPVPKTNGETNYRNLIEQLGEVEFSKYRRRELLQTIYELRAATAEQVFARLPHLFPTLRKCRLCLSHMTEDGEVLRVEQYRTRSEPNKPYIYLLSSEGALKLTGVEALRYISHLDWSRHERYAKPSHYMHQVQNNWVRIRVELSAREAGFTISQWHDERKLRRTHSTAAVTINGVRGERITTHVFPDQHFVATRQRLKFTPFIETDLEHEFNKKWKAKINAYNSFFAKKKGVSVYNRLYGFEPEQVLTVTQSEDWLQYLLKRTSEANGRLRFWFTTIDHVMKENYFEAPIWQVATVAGTYSLVAGPTDWYSS